MTLTTMYCYNCLIVLLALVNLLLCLMYKLNFLTGTCVERRKQDVEGQVLTVVSGVHWGPWNMSSVGYAVPLSRRKRAGWRRSPELPEVHKVI